MEELVTLWPDILESLKEELKIHDITFNTFIKPLEVYSLDGKDLYILSPDNSNSVAINLIKNRYSNAIMIKIAEFTNKEYVLHFILPKDIKSDEKNTFFKSDNHNILLL